MGLQHPDEPRLGTERGHAIRRQRRGIARDLVGPGAEWYLGQRVEDRGLLLDELRAGRVERGEEPGAISGQEGDGAGIEEGLDLGVDDRVVTERWTRRGLGERIVDGWSGTGLRHGRGTARPAQGAQQGAVEIRPRHQAGTEQQRGDDVAHEEDTGEDGDQSTSRVRRAGGTAVPGLLRHARIVGGCAVSLSIRSESRLAPARRGTGPEPAELVHHSATDPSRGQISRDSPELRQGRTAPAYGPLLSIDAIATGLLGFEAWIIWPSPM